MKAYRWNSGIEPLRTSALDGTVWLTVHSWRCTPRREPQYPWNRRLGRPQSRSGHFRKETNLLSLKGFEPWSSQPIAKLLYQLHCCSLRTKLLLIHFWTNVLIVQLPCFGNVTYLKHWMSGIVTRHYGLVVSVLLHYWEVGFKSSMETILYCDHFFSVCRQILWSHFHIYMCVCMSWPSHSHNFAFVPSIDTFCT